MRYVYLSHSSPGASGATPGAAGAPRWGRISSHGDRFPLTGPLLGADTPNMTAKELKSELAKCAACVCANLRMASRAITQLYDGALQPIGLRSTQYSVLIVVALQAPIALTRLAELLIMDRTTLTRNLRPLESQGLIATRPGKDRRRRIITLTRKGRSTLRQALPLWEQAQDSVVKQFGTTHWETMREGLHSLAGIAQEER